MKSAEHKRQHTSKNHLPLTILNPMVQFTKSAQEFRSLAQYLSNEKHNILEDWETLLRDEDEKQVSKLMTLSREKFHNHVPVFIDTITKCFYREHESPEDIAKEHGAQRWEHGLDLREIIKEWGRLHRVIIDYVNSAKDAISLSFETFEEAQKIVTELVYEGMQNSVNEYYELQNREAEAQMKDLETALSQKEIQDENLQQTSHDLKGILSSLQIGISLLKKNDFDEKTTDILEEMSLAADNLEQLLNDLLELFRLEAGKEKVNITTFNAAQILNEIYESLKPLAAAKNLDLHCRGKDEFSVKGDKKKIQRIAQNLLINALKYTDEGEVKMDWELESEENWQLTISDTGPGLSTTKAQFLTTEAEHAEGGEKSEGDTGEGIGLLIVRQLCKLLNAVIKIETAPKEGTTFRIIFPQHYSE